MELVFDIISGPQLADDAITHKTFKQAGGIIGRGEDSDWVIPDRKRILSNHHAEISYRDGAFYLTDISSNGILLKDSGAQLNKSIAQRIEHGNIYCLGDFEIQARLIHDPAQFTNSIGLPQTAGNIIPDDAFLDLDPLVALDQQERAYAEVDALTAVLQPEQTHIQQPDYAQIDEENLLVPHLITPEHEAEPAPVPEPERLPETFWSLFSAALGISLDGLDEPARQELAINAARLLRQSISGLQQTLRTRTELKNELRLPLTTPQSTGSNPLKQAGDPSEALQALLCKPRNQTTAEQCISRGFNDLQAHQVALLAASRASARSLLEQLSPAQLLLRFERDERKPLIATRGSHWRAYCRMHQALTSDPEWGERLFARDFINAYETQARLIATLNTNLQG